MLCPDPPSNCPFSGAPPCKIRTSYAYSVYSYKEEGLETPSHHEWARAVDALDVIIQTGRKRWPPRTLIRKAPRNHRGMMPIERYRFHVDLDGVVEPRLGVRGTIPAQRHLQLHEL